MKIKKFSAATIAEALTLAKQEMGSQAVILGTARRAGRSGSVVEVVVASGEEVEQMANAAVSQQAGSGGRLERIRKLDGDVLSELRRIETRLQEIAESIVGDALMKGTSALGNLLEAGFDPTLLRTRVKLDHLTRTDSFETLVASLLDDITIERPLEKVAIFVGPSGSGKTTTVLKVARRCAEQNGNKPIIVFFGSKSAREVPWLKRQSKRLGVRFRVVTEPDDLERLIAKNRSKSILVDTPGLSDLSDSHLRYLVDLTKGDLSVRLHLVIEATMDPHNILAIASCIPGSPNMGLVLTKMDEATRIGGAISVALANALPLTYVTGGTKLTDGIFVADHGIIREKVFESLEHSS